MTPVLSVADLHGRLDLLEGALRVAGGAHLVVLGDVIDRGPLGLACVRRLLELHEAGRVTLLRGNHEQMLESAVACYGRYTTTHDLEDYRAAVTRFGWWANNGGESVRQEAGGFGVENLPPELLEYFSRLLDGVYVDADGGLHAAPPAAPSVLATHAAPPKPHPEYGDALTASLWMRPYDGPFPLPPGVTWSVHGHTPVREPCRLGEQIYSDLGAVRTGRLALVDLHPDGPRDVIVVTGTGSGRASRLPSFGLILPSRRAQV
jgi:serine/threonine protein phosphatase 1